MSEEGVGVNFVSHYNMKLGVCFAQIHLEDQKTIHTTYMLADAVADRVYAYYDWDNYAKSGLGGQAVNVLVQRR
jgi:hypothetical protein